MNFNYGYNVKAAQPLQAKQVEKVKEEVVEKKEAEVKADAPKYEVVTGDADKILADINKATVKGAGGVEGGDRGGNYTLDQLMDRFKSEVRKYKSESAGWNVTRKMSYVCNNIMSTLTAITSVPEFEDCDEEFKRDIVGKFIEWNAESNNILTDMMENIQDYSRADIKATACYFANSCSNMFMDTHAYGATIVPNQHTGFNTICQYANENVAELIADKLKLSLDFIYAAAPNNGNLGYIGINTLYESLSTVLAEQQASVSGDPLAEMNMLYDKQNLLDNIFSSNFFNIPNPMVLNSNSINPPKLKNDMIQDYISTNAQIDTLLINASNETVAHIDKLDENHVLEMVNLYQNVLDTDARYDNIFDRLNPAQNLAFFESKYNANLSILTCIDAMLAADIAMDAELHDALVELRSHFDELLTSTKLHIEAAQAAANAQ